MSLLDKFKTLFGIDASIPSRAEENALFWDKKSGSLSVHFEKNGTVIKWHKNTPISSDVLWIPHGKESLAAPHFADFFRKKTKNAKKV